MEVVKLYLRRNHVPTETWVRQEEALLLSIECNLHEEDNRATIQEGSWIPY